MKGPFKWINPLTKLMLLNDKPGSSWLTKSNEILVKRTKKPTRGSDFSSLSKNPNSTNISTTGVTPDASHFKSGEYKTPLESMKASKLVCIDLFGSNNSNGSVSQSYSSNASPGKIKKNKSSPHINTRRLWQPKQASKHLFRLGMNENVDTSETDECIPAF